jgi:hypothetical protein
MTLSDDIVGYFIILIAKCLMTGCSAMLHVRQFLAGI